MDLHMYLVVGDDRHRLKEGITLIGSAENDRYTVIRLQHKSICAKHAAIKCSSTSRDVYMMDLCSHAGVQVTDDRVHMQPAPPLEWLKLYGNKVKLVFGAITCRLEISNSTDRKSYASMESFFESSIESVDCSLDEAPQMRSRLVTNKLSNNKSENISDSVNQNTKASPKKLSISKPEENSFLIPATQNQTVNNASCSSTRNSTSIADKTRTSLQQASIDEEDDLFFIPETQECNEQPDESQIIEPIGGTIGQGEKEEDFLRFETEDDENTGDGLFNNPYVESQNLLNDLDESYRKNLCEERKSVLPDRSVDSISFHGRIPPEETDEELSKIEWNDSRAASKGKVSVEPIAAEVDRESGSVTPELDFGSRPGSARYPVPVALTNEEQRVESVTPDLEFDRLTPQQPDPVLVKRLSLRKDAFEDILQQSPADHEGRSESVTPDLDNFPAKEKEETDHNPYLAATQILPAEQNDVMLKSTSIYELATQLDPVTSNEVPPTLGGAAYDLLTQKIPEEAPPNLPAIGETAYDLLTQKFPEELPRNAPTCGEAAYDVLTQKMPKEALQSARSLRKALIKVTDLRQDKGNVSIRANKEFELDPFQLATQPLIADEAHDVYDIQTQALRTASNTEDGFDPETDTIPLALVSSPLQGINLSASDDLYNLQTQPLVTKTSDSSLPLDGTFRPPVNSTCRQSVLGNAIFDEDQEAESKSDQLNISPSSNKENQEEVTKHRSGSSSHMKSNTKRRISSDFGASERTIAEEFNQSDEEYCLAATLPVADTGDKIGKDSSSKKNNKSNAMKSNTSFKIPENRKTPSSAKSSTVSSNDSKETPRSKANSEGDPLSFDFNTPDHPFLNVVKKDKILAVSDMIKNRTSDTAKASKYKYIFGDSSDEDQEPNKPVFLKKDSKVQVMKYDKEERKNTKSVFSEESKKLPERHSTRDRKKTRRYSDDDSRSVASTRSSTRSGRSTASSTSKMKVDESVDYQQAKANQAKTRKRKAAEIPALPTDDVPNEPPKYSKTNEKTVEDVEPKAGPSKLTEPVVTKRSNRLKRTAKEDGNDDSSSKPAVNRTVPEVEQRTSRTKSKRPTAAKSAMDKLPSTDEASSASEAMNTSISGSESPSGTRKSSRVDKPRLMFTKMSPEPYKGVITRAVFRKMQRK
ncbi:uncharacterized protein LOC129721942 isoform X2 [Wyeomyia smithii]|uniref:uncharacterized protein LOC129721942 isoform X2 n=1 Tax=Wyeomyia smithii TaxID=174621 RepID=UPI00246800F0|nr:uncharacterized protein LOC129721942 isoform X2 [Wyeomyia smithii]